MDKEGAGQRPPAKEFRLEHQTQTQARAERLLEEIVVHAEGCERQFEVLVINTEPLVDVLVNECLVFAVSDVKGIETKFETDPLTNFPWILKVRINASCCRCTTQVAAAEKRNLARILIRLLSNQGSQRQARLNSEDSAEYHFLQTPMIQDVDWVNVDYMSAIRV